MAPRGGRARAESLEHQGLFDLGKQGRKTGVVLHDNGERDEDGFQPMDIFSSPLKNPESPNGADEDEDEDDDGSVEMDIEDSQGPGPQTLLKGQRERLSQIPRSRSPVKTQLRSPAKRPQLEKLSSPMRGSVEDRDLTVTRKLNFNAAQTNGRLGLGGPPRLVPFEEVPSEQDEEGLALLDDSVRIIQADLADDDEEKEEEEEEEDDEPIVAPVVSTKKPGRGRPKRVVEEPVEEEDVEDEVEEVEAEEDEEDDEPIVAPVVSTKKPGRGRPKRVVEEPPEEEDQVEEEEGPEAGSADEEVVEKPVPVVSAKKPRGRPKRNSVEAPKEPEAVPEDAEDQEQIQPKQRGRPKGTTKPSPKTKTKPIDEPVPTRGTKRRSLRSSIGEEGEEAESRQAKRPRPSKEPPPKPPAAETVKKTAPAAPKVKAPGQRGRPPKAAVQEDDAAGEQSFMALQRGPPLPKNRGLVSVRAEPDIIKQTRSGRNSFKPLNYWAGDQVITTDESHDDVLTNGRGFVVGGMKEIVRIQDTLQPVKRGRKGQRARGRPAKLKAVKEEEDDEDLEDWEASPGTIEAEVIVWENEHEIQPPAEDEEVQVTDERIAIAAPAIQTREIRDATFRFAKTLTTPFMGAGVVDLPPGAEKRPKNSRKMHMVFFVHYGKVEVSVNEVTFRISTGGIWFVPRGNYYKISNDYDKPARVFFSQACEMSMAGGASQMDMSQGSFLLAQGE